MKSAINLMPSYLDSDGPGVPGDVFSICVYYPDGTNITDGAPCVYDEANRRVVELAGSIGGQLGAFTRIVISDKNGRRVFEWAYLKGVVYPRLSSYHPNHVVHMPSY